ncbi:MAG: hypothetical protein KDJ67_05380 [Nitratireductor sp.]|nr:hypothetical protein [Nitratireductor sp.]
MPYRTLNPDKIIATAETISMRISERFPQSGLARVGSELVAIARDAKSNAEALAKPIWWLRAVVIATMVAGALVFAFVGTFLSFDRVGSDGFDFVQGIEASINMLVLVGIGFVTLYKAEERIKQRKVLDGLHPLRSLIHIIDMHQLTKDPVTLKSGFKRTASSPVRSLSTADLSRYLDYCSEMLAITGKLAALYAQAVPDPQVVEAVNDVEGLGSNLSRKIWQKIMLIEPEKPMLRKKG